MDKVSRKWNIRSIFGDDVNLIHRLQGGMKAQFKIYGRRAFLESASVGISAAIHDASQSALGLPAEQRFHRFLPLEDWQFIVPEDRSDRYLIIEVMMFEGRPMETKKTFYAELLRNLNEHCGIGAHDVELTITESPRHNWLIRGLPADELTLNYNVEHQAASGRSISE